MHLNKPNKLISRLCLLQILCASSILSAQSDETHKELPLIGLGAGFTYFHGDVGLDNRTGGSFRSGFRFGVEQRFLNTLGAEVYGVYGTLTANERSVSFNRNFSTKFMSIGGGLMVDFDNDFILSRRATVGPYLGVGFMWMSFDPYGDLKDAKDSTYYYWTDGSIRDLAQNDPNALNAGYLTRDYTYETQLKDSTTNYARSTFGIPLSVGSKLKFSRHAGADFRFTYNLTFTDYIDNTKFDRNDSWAFASVSLYYQFYKGPKENGTKGQEILNEDSDKDGVRDADDLCAGTPPGVKVDRNGCPPDKDEDGVPDYRDKELNTPKNTPVDKDGVTTKLTQTDSLGNVINPDCIPVEYRAADLDGNCVITADEINAVVDDFFDGEGGWTADKINGLIDYFFEQ